jgi:CheY-like chemotaxis protein
METRTALGVSDREAPERPMQQTNAPAARALIIEDEILIALELEDVLAGLGYAVCGLAPNGSKALNLAISHKPNLALVDVRLERSEEGIEIARRLREVCGAAIVFVTASVEQRTLDRIKEQVPGAPVVAKPVAPKRLAEAVARVVQAQQRSLGGESPDDESGTHV